MQPKGIPIYAAAHRELLGQTSLLERYGEPKPAASIRYPSPKHLTMMS